jgi:hypothetical protein
LYRNWRRVASASNVDAYAELFHDWCALVVGADADTYRRIPAIEGRQRRRNLRERYGPLRVHGRRGARRRLARPRDRRVQHGHDCEFGTRDCMVNDLRLATGLIGRMAVRPAGPPEGGPWPQRIVMATVLAAGILLAGFTAATLLVLRVN